MGGGDVDGDRAVLPSPPLAEVTLALVGKIGTGKSATANCILGTQAFASEYPPGSVTETCQRSSATFHDGCGAARAVNVIDTPGLFDMEISIEDARKEIVKCIEMSKDGIHAMLMVFSAASRFSREEHSAVESIKLFFGDKILDHLILVFTHGDEVGEEVAWKKMIAVKSPIYLKDMLKLCQNRVVLFDNKTKGIEHCEIQRKKLLGIVDFVISSNNGKAFSYHMLPHIKEANEGQNENSVDAYSAERIYEHLTRITKTVDDNLNITEEEIWRLKESLERSQKEHHNVKQEMTNAENLRRLDEEKMKEQKEEMNKLRDELEKARHEEMLLLEKSHKEHHNVKQEMTNAENLRRLDEEKMKEQKEEMNKLREELEKARHEEMLLLEKSHKEHHNVKQEMTNAENLRRLDEEKMKEQKEEMNKLREELEKARREEMLRKEKEIERLMASLEHANKEKEHFKTMYDNKCIVM